MGSFSTRFHDALVYAAHLHADQFRKGTKIPYVSHLLGVAGLTMEYGATEDEAIGALLHDAVEDQGGRPTLEEVRRRFGEDIASHRRGLHRHRRPTEAPVARAEGGVHRAHSPR